jgi:hypothetical protein
VDPASNRLPEFRKNGDWLIATYTAPDGRENLIYSAEWSTTLQPGTWTEIPDTGSGNTHVFKKTAGEERVFMRFVTRLP